MEEILSSVWVPHHLSYPWATQTEVAMHDSQRSAGGLIWTWSERPGSGRMLGRQSLGPGVEWGRPSMGSSASHSGQGNKDYEKPGRPTVREPRRQKGFQAA